MATGAAEPITERWLADHLPARGARAHKGDFGRVLVVAGSLEYTGAALLTALGAMRAGAGLATVATADSVHARLAGAAPEVTWMVLDEEAPGLIGPGGWRHVATAAATYDAVVIGPGLGRLPATQRRARGFVTGLGRTPAVVDADGLNALAAEPHWWRDTRAPLVLTPHPGEFARLSGAAAPAADDDAGRRDAAAAAAVRWNQVVALKGARTIVASPDGGLLESTVANPSLATAGSGDVLAGAIGAYLAAGLRPLDAAACGVGIHGAAGMLAGQRIGEAGTLATDIAALLPEARRIVTGRG